MFQLHEKAGGTEVTVRTTLTLAGSIIQYARGVGMVTKTAQQLVEQFSTRLAERIDSGDVPDATAIKMGKLLWSSLRSTGQTTAKDGSVQ
jgi:hypothetical protein